MNRATAKGVDQGAERPRDDTAKIRPRRVGRPPGPSASREKFDQRRFELLQAAARTFNDKGYHLATLDDIAQEFGITRAAIYHYAKSKDELLFACGQLAYDALREALGQTNRDASGLERLENFFRIYGRTICEDFGRCLVYTRPRDLAPDTRPKSLVERRVLTRAVREMIVDGIQDGSIRRCDDRALAMALFDAFNGLARWHKPEGDTPLDTVIDHYLEIFFRGAAARE
jgi:TetR/AcrR family transcriptional regulator, cholesterol catabolism regulator